MTRSPFSRLRALAVASVVSLALLASGCAQGGSNEASTGGASAPATQADADRRRAPRREETTWDLVT